MLHVSYVLQYSNLNYLLLTVKIHYVLIIESSNTISFSYFDPKLIFLNFTTTTLSIYYSMVNGSIIKNITYVNIIIINIIYIIVCISFKTAIS